jgi:hypothetical protein
MDFQVRPIARSRHAVGGDALARVGTQRTGPKTWLWERGRSSMIELSKWTP